ncbi:MAG TPA: hypothetical protein VFV72_01825 [Candidatus Limnocylindrales bacterium]|nr:hypothetical protein [Candidatus Limnocylindrales bacterium]
MDEGRPPDPDIAAVDGAAAASVEFPPEEVPIEPRGPSRALIAITVVVIAALVVFAVLGGRISAPNAVPTMHSEQRLAVTDGDGRFYTINRDGSGSIEYAIKGTQFGFPAWSPDGTRIAITGEGRDGIRLYLWDAATGAATASPTTSTAEPAVLYDELGHPPFYLYWSPDGRQIAFLTSEPDGIALRLVSTDAAAGATPAARVVREGSPLYWDWLGNDHLVTHIGVSGDDAFLGEVDLDGTSTESETLSPGYFRSPAVSSDGAFRAYVTSARDLTGTVTVESMRTSQRSEASVFGVAAVSFDPTGSTVAYVASEEQGADDLAFPLGPLKLLDPRTGVNRTLVDGEVVAFYWAPDGETIAVLTFNPADDEVVGAPNARVASTRGSQPDAADEPPPPGAGVPLTLSFVDVVTGTVRGTRLIDITSRYVNNILPYFDQYNLSHRTWAPDSSAIALPVVVDGRDRLAVIPADGSGMTPLPNAELGFWSP